MAHADDMLARLPQLYRDGELVRAVMEQPALQLEILDEDLNEVQRAHWFDAGLELREAAGLAAILDIAPEPWQRLHEYRAWVHAIRDAMLRRGAVTRRALEQFVVDYSRRYQAATGVRVWDTAQAWVPEPSTGGPALVENPLRRRYDSAPPTGGIEPLHQFSVVQKGLDETSAAFLLVGLPTAPESAPLIANLTAGQAILFLGTIPPGARLWIRPVPGGDLEAFLEGQDVSGQMRSISGLQPGSAWSNLQVQQPARRLTLKHGKNDLWFLPVAHLDVLGLDRFLLALADLLLQQGRYDQVRFDSALFYQDPAVLLRMTWLETEPASVDIYLPPGRLLSPAGQLDESLAERDRLQFSLNSAVQGLKAAGVRAAVEMPPFREVQGQLDRLAAVLPMTSREAGPSGADRLPEVGAIFEVTDFDDSTYR
jgi:hypothetical protein